MRRSSVWFSLGLALVIGVLAGGVLFDRVGPIPLSTGPERTSGAKPATSVGSSSTASTSKSKPSSIPTPKPPFTAKALLQPEELTDRGWGRATVTQRWDSVPDSQITSCVEVSASGTTVAAYAATYRGLNTTAAEVVIRFTDETAARLATQPLIDQISSCMSPAGDEVDVFVKRLEPPETDGVISEVYLWEITGSDNLEGAIGLARTDDRIALLTMRSKVTDPTKTTLLSNLTQQAGRRLV